jgi:hypothetical protein
MPFRWDALSCSRRGNHLAEFFGEVVVGWLGEVMVKFGKQFDERFDVDKLEWRERF